MRVCHADGRAQEQITLPLSDLARLTSSWREAPNKDEEAQGLRDDVVDDDVDAVKHVRCLPLRRLVTALTPIHTHTRSSGRLLLPTCKLSQLHSDCHNWLTVHTNYRL